MDQVLSPNFGRHEAYTCMHTRMRTHMHTRMRTRMHTRMRTHMHTRMQVITPILGRDDVYAVSCFAEQYAYYVEGALAAGVAVLPWGEWLMQPLGSQALPLRYASFGSQLNDAVELGYDSGEVVPQSIGCSVAILQPSNNADERLAQATFLQDLAHYARLRLPAKVHIYSHSFAEAVSNDQEIVKNIIITIIVALCAVRLHAYMHDNDQCICPKILHMHTPLQDTPAIHTRR